MEHVAHAQIIRTTRSTCPVCLAEIPATILKEQAAVMLQKKCPQHGEFRIPLSDIPDYFAQLSDAYFTLLPKDMPCRVIDITLTPSCNLRCPICCASDSFGIAVKEMSLEDVEKITKKNPHIQEFFFGHMEPTQNPELATIISFLTKQGKKTHLFTNGLKLLDPGFLVKLKEAGLSSIYLQFDGFDSSTYTILRGEDLSEKKLRILESLKKLDMPVILNVTVAKGVNEKELARIIDYAVSNSFIRQIGILPLIRLGSAQASANPLSLGGSDILHILERESGGRIAIDNVRVLQKLLYAVFRFARFRRCFWFTLFVLIRDGKGGYKTLDELVDFKALERALDAYIRKVKKGPGFINDLIFFSRLAMIMVNRKTLPLALVYARFILLGKKVGIARSSDKLLFLACTDFCDFYKMDLDMADDYCEEFLYIKNSDNDLIHQHTYRMLIDERKKIIDSGRQRH